MDATRKRYTCVLVHGMWWSMWINTRFPLRYSKIEGGGGEPCALLCAQYAAYTHMWPIRRACISGDRIFSWNMFTRKNLIFLRNDLERTQVDFPTFEDWGKQKSPELDTPKGIGSIPVQLNCLINAFTSWNKWLLLRRRSCHIWLSVTLCKWQSMEMHNVGSIKC